LLAAAAGLGLAASTAAGADGGDGPAANTAFTQLLGVVAQADVMQRIVSGRTKNQDLHTLLPWNWRPPSTAA
jgi:hypothetical protein